MNLDKTFNRVFKICILSLVSLIAGIALWIWLIVGASVERVAAYPYGNLWVKYATQTRGRLLRDEVPFLIVTTTYPKDQAYDAETGTHRFAFGNGKEYTFQSDAEHLIWIAPETGPLKVEVSLTPTLLHKIKHTGQDAATPDFVDPEQWLKWLEIAETAPVESPAQ